MPLREISTWHMGHTDSWPGQYRIAVHQSSLIVVNIAHEIHPQPRPYWVCDTGNSTRYYRRQTRSVLGHAEGRTWRRKLTHPARYAPTSRKHGPLHILTTDHFILVMAIPKSAKPGIYCPTSIYWKRHEVCHTWSKKRSLLRAPVVTY